MTETVMWPRKTRELQTRLFDSSIWNQFAFRDDDIVIATFSKAGTTWMQQIVGQFRYRGDPDLDVATSSPWVDMQIPPKEEREYVVDASVTACRYVNNPPYVQESRRLQADFDEDKIEVLAPENLLHEVTSVIHQEVFGRRLRAPNKIVG